MQTAILIPTFPKYRKLAEHTAGAIRRLWKNHPEIYFAGCHGPRTAGWLVCLDETASWIKIMQEALRQLVIERGYEAIYLILDDHPPLGECHEKHLNETLVQYLREWNATTICLLGCDQGQGRVGEKLEREYYQMEKIQSGYSYLFSLHPSLWNGKKLMEVLESTEKYAIEKNIPLSPWTFEKTAQQNSHISKELKENCYRVCGSQMTIRESVWRSLRRRWKLRMFLKRFGKDYFKDLEHWYEGPYPHIWSGMMRGGGVSDLYERVLLRYGSKDSQEGFELLKKKHITDRKE